eukprot:m.202114 g.202114  ORF g.202114 m.202114 type:complete len:111 (+) comp13719_c1_seq4:1208-1540(+)
MVVYVCVLCLFCLLACMVCLCADLAIQYPCCIFQGGVDIAGTNIVYANGLIDPWHVLSVTYGPFKEGCTAFIMPDNAHCSNMYPPRDSDTPELKAARAGIIEYIEVWLSQ